MRVICVCLPSLRPIVKFLPWSSHLKMSVESCQPSGPSTCVSGLEHGSTKTKQPLVDEYELLEENRPSCWIEIERTTEEHSINTVEGECISVQTRVHTSSADIERPAETI